MTEQEIIADLLVKVCELSDLFRHAIATPGYGQDWNSREEAEHCLARVEAAVRKVESA